MVMYAVVKTGGKQYIVKENDSLTVDLIEANVNDNIDLPALALFDDEAKKVEIGTPFLTKKVKAQVVTHGQGEKIRVAKFKSKVRYRKVMGFRPQLTTLKIVKI